MAKWRINNEYDLLPESPVKMPPLLWRFFYGRQISTKDSIDELFSPKMKNLTCPFSLDGMDVAVKRIISAIENREKICVYGDFDLDGTSGIALLKTGLTRLGVEDLSIYQPKRLSEGYGLHVHAVELLHQQGVSLIITVDLGITAVAAVARANQLGMEVIITDHHLPADELPQALTIINPNKGFCSSGLEHLCGAGVGFYLILALRIKLKEKGLLKKDFNPKELLDCFTIGTLTDLVPLKNENRILVKHGLTVLKNTKRPALKALLQELGLYKQDLSGSDVAIRFAPKLNALSRMEGELLPLDLYLEEDEAKAQNMIKDVMKINNQRIKLQTQAQHLAEQLVKQKNQQGFIFISSSKFHQGIVGLVATRLMQNYNVPTFVGTEKEDGSITGSARLPDFGFPSLVDALKHSNSALGKFGGHKQAAGFELKQANANHFAALLNEYYQSFYENNKQPELEIFYDAEATVSDITPEFMNWMSQLEPFGKGFEAPLFKIIKLKITTIKELKGGHLRFTLQCTESNIIRQGLWFSPPENSKLLQVGQSLEVLSKPQWNHYNGNSSIQLLLDEVRVVCI